MKNTKTNSKSGGVLVMVMVVMIAFSILAVGLYKLHETDAVETVYVEQANQAFWLAESGMQRALHKLRTEKSFRTFPGSLNETVGAGTYDVNVTTVSSNTWNIVSTGTVMSISRVLTLNPLLTAEIGYALMGLGGDSKLDKDGTINDDVYSFGKLTVNGRSAPSISGEVLALDTRNLAYTKLTSDDRVEMEITAPITDFSVGTDTLPLPYIDADPDGDGITNTYLNLIGSNTVVKISSDYDFEISPGVYADGTYGNGTLIVDGSLTFKNSGAPFIIDDGARVYVNGDLWAGKDGTFGKNVIVYVTGDMTLQKAAGSDSTTFLVEGNLTVKKELIFNGLIFAEGSVTVDGDLTLKGSLIAGEDFWLKDGYDVSYDGSQIPPEILNNMILYVTYATSPGTWNEIPAP